MDAQALEQTLAEICGTVLRNEPMAAHTTFAVGGPAWYYVRPTTPEQIFSTIQAAQGAGISWWVIGCGSDLLVADEGLPGVVIELGAMNTISLNAECNQIEAGPGATNAEVAEVACKAGLSGYEFASGIPGSIGGAAIMNAGAYDGEFKKVAHHVVVLDPFAKEFSLRSVYPEQADWGYRHSMMSDANLVIVSVTLQLLPGNEAQIRARMDDLAARRNAKQPLDMASAGSTFKRPEGYFAGKLIQDSHMQGHRVGAAQVSEKHAGFVVNTGGASAAEVRQVILDVQEAVRAQFGVELEPEVRMWGF